ncbi:release factor glutamine methyltransferase-like [Oculina patagonica]
MSNVTEFKQLTSAIDDMRTLAANEPRTSILGKDFLVYPEVFHPGASFATTEFRSKEILTVIKEDLTKKAEEESFDFLEVGCGAGCTTVLVALASQRCHVWATDINETAVENTIENAKLHGVDARVKVVIADVFNHENLVGKKFDMIYWNIAWGGQHTEPGIDLDLLMRSVLDPGYQSFRRYLLEAKNHLKKAGRILVAFSFSFGSKELFDRVVKETGWSYKISSRDNFLIEIADKQQEIDVSIVEFLKQE